MGPRNRTIEPSLCVRAVRDIESLHGGEFVKSIPLFLFVIGVYNALIFTTPELLDQQLYEIVLMSGSNWILTGNELFLIGCLGVLYLEILKATIATQATVLDHVLSTMVFVGAMMEFLMVAEAGNSTFLTLTVMCLFDVIAGFTVTIAAARRDLNVLS